jgi:hypothetical protein
MENDEKAFLLLQIDKLQRSRNRWRKIAIIAWIVITLGPLLVGLVGGVGYFQYRSARIRAELQAVQAAQAQLEAARAKDAAAEAKKAEQAKSNRKKAETADR